MEQVQQPWSDNQYILSFNCRSFPLWAEFDPFCWRENLSMHSLSQYNVFKQMIQRQQIVVHVKGRLSIYSVSHKVEISERFKMKDISNEDEGYS